MWYDLVSPKMLFTKMRQIEPLLISQKGKDFERLRKSLLPGLGPEQPVQNDVTHLLFIVSPLPPSGPPRHRLVREVRVRQQTHDDQHARLVRVLDGHPMRSYCPGIDSI